MKRTLIKNNDVVVLKRFLKLYDAFTERLGIVQRALKLFRLFITNAVLGTIPKENTNIITLYVKCHNALDCEYRYLHHGTALLAYQIEESKVIDDWANNGQNNVTNACSSWLKRNAEHTLAVNARNRGSVFYQRILNADLALEPAEVWLATDLRKTLRTP